MEDSIVAHLAYGELWLTTGEGVMRYAAAARVEDLWSAAAFVRNQLGDIKAEQEDLTSASSGSTG